MCAATVCEGLRSAQAASVKRLQPCSTGSSTAIRGGVLVAEDSERIPTVSVLVVAAVGSLGRQRATTVR
jgi:hypothetical protein